MGVVFAGRQESSGRPVAVKLIQRGRLGHAAVDRFIRETRVLASIRHPGVVEYVDHGLTSAGDPYLVMEWLDGRDLASRLQNGALSIEDVRVLGERLAEALNAAHHAGIVHRDLKPANVFLVEDRVDCARLLDFGIARFVDQTRGLTQTGGVLGSPGYMSPEQAQGAHTVDHRTDLFALGCVMFECLTGRPAFPGLNVMAVLAKVLMDSPPRVHSLIPGVPAALDQLIDDLLEKDPEKRPSSAAEVSDRLARVDHDAEAETKITPEALTLEEQSLYTVIFIRRDELGETLAASATLPQVNYQRTAAEFGGSALGLVDGTQIVYLSASHAVVDQAVTAARCALALRDQDKTQTLALVSARGVVTGHSLVGQVLDRGATSIRPGENGAIRIDETTASLLDERFILGGDDHGLLLEREQPAASGDRRLMGKPSPFVGRSRELAVLEAALSETIDESCANAIVVIGEAGIGKSRLRHEFLGRLHDRVEPASVLFGRGDSMSSGAAFALLGRSLRALAGVQDGEPARVQRRKLRARVSRHLAPVDIEHVVAFLGELASLAQADELPSLRAARQDPGLMHEQIREAWLSWLLAESRAAPVVLVLEDLHWGDRASIQLVGTSLHRLEDQPFFVLALARPSVAEGHPDLWRENEVETIELRPLSTRAARRLVRQLLGSDCDPDFVSRLIGAAEGNAFFLEELIRSAVAGESERIPESVFAMMQARQRVLDAGTRMVLRAASVFGRVFWAAGIQELIGHASDRADLPGILNALAAEEWITRRPHSQLPGEDEFVFRHDLVRETAYSTLTEEDRKLGHRLAGQWLARITNHEPAVLAEHFGRGDRVELAIPWLLRAASQAIDGDDFAAAITFAERAIEFGALGKDLGTAHLRRAEAKVWLGYHDEAIGIAHDAIEHLPQRTAGWYSAVRNLLEALGRQAKFEELCVWIERVLDGPPSGAFTEELLFALCGGVHHLPVGGRVHDAERYASRIRANMMSLSHYGPRTRQDFHQMEAFIADALGLVGVGLHHALLALDAANEVGSARNTIMFDVYAGHFLNEVGAHERAREHLERALRGSEETNLAHAAMLAHENLVLLWHRERDIPQARFHMDRAALLFVGPSPRYEGVLYSLNSMLARAEGDLSLALEHAEKAEEFLRVVPTLHAHGLVELSRSHLALGNSRQALKWARHAKTVLASLEAVMEFESDVHVAFVEALTACGLLDETRGAVQEAVTSLERRSQSIEEPSLRKSFLERVPANRRTIELAHNHGIAIDLFATDPLHAPRA